MEEIDEGAAPPASQWQTSHGEGVREGHAVGGSMPESDERGPGGCVALGMGLPRYAGAELHEGSNLRRCIGAVARPLDGELCACWCTTHLREKLGRVYRWSNCGICGKPLR